MSEQSVCEMHDAAAPYPHRLQHREEKTRHVRAATHAVTAWRASEESAPHGDLTEAEQHALQHRIDAKRELQSKQAAHTASAIDVINSECGLTLAQPASEAQDCRLDLFHAACDGDVEMLRRNLAAGAEVNARGQPHPGRYGGPQFEKRWTFCATPLIFSAAFGRERAVRALLQWGADVRMRSSTGLTAKDYAAARGYATIVAILAEAEAKLPVAQ